MGGAARDLRANISCHRATAFSTHGAFVRPEHKGSPFSSKKYVRKGTSDQGQSAERRPPHSRTSPATQPVWLRSGPALESARLEK